MNLEPVTTAEPTDAAGSLFALYTPEETEHWPPLLAWLPIVLASLASLACAIEFCPVPPPKALTPRTAILLAIVYVVVTVATGAGVLGVWNLSVARRRTNSATWEILSIFCAVSAWIAPTTAFLARNSFWAVAAAAALAIALAHLIGSHSAIRDEASPADRRQYAKRRIWLTLAALLLQLGIVSTLASRAHAAALLVGSSLLTIMLFRGTTVARLTPSQDCGRSSISFALATLFVAASLIPYLSVPRSEGREPGPGRNESATRPASLAELLEALLARLLPSNGSSDRRPQPDSASTQRPYPLLQRFFGDEKKSRPAAEQTPRRPDSVALVPGESFRGVILRPREKNDTIIDPPAPLRRVYDRRPNQRSVNPVSIPFDGAYWFFRRVDGTLPEGAVEMRGDADSTSLKTTDYTPIRMEAHQYLGSQIDLSCCHAIEVVIANADRRPNSVQMELVLQDTAVAGKPEQSLGSLPINSSLQWTPEDNGEPKTEVLKFPIPAHSSIGRFDEATVRFHLRSPRERFSAKIAIVKFRLVP